jgi:hypothetical protein
MFEYPPHQFAASSGGSTRPITVAARLLFNRSVRDHIQGKGLYLTKTLEDLDGHATEIPDFPRPSVALKTEWMRVSANECTPIPVWHGEPASPDLLANPPEDWREHVHVYAPGVSPATCGKGRQVPLRDFYHIRIGDKSEIKDWTSLTVGDYAVLVGFHFATREIPKWVWATFWWHDRPTEGPFAADRPRSVRSVWRHYLMDVAYDMDRPREHDASPKITFNPYLEGAQIDGVRSNCMVCHRRAVWGRQPGIGTLSSFGDPLPISSIVVRGSEAARATYMPDFDRRLKLHFLWSIAIHTLDCEHQPTLPGCPKTK